jgi:hypothetical protein
MIKLTFALVLFTLPHAAINETGCPRPVSRRDQI